MKIIIYLVLFSLMVTSALAYGTIYSDGSIDVNTGNIANATSVNSTLFYTSTWGSTQWNLAYLNILANQTVWETDTYYGNETIRVNQISANILANQTTWETDNNNANQTLSFSNPNLILTGGGGTVDISGIDTTIGNCSGDTSCSNILYKSEVNTLDKLNGLVSDTILNETSIDSKLITTYYNVTTVQAVRGTPAGTLTDLQAYNGGSYNVTEVAGAIGLDIRFNFTNVTTFNQLIFRYKNTVGESHILKLQVWDYGDLAWENYGTASEVSDWTIFTFPVFDNTAHVNNSKVLVRVVSEDNGNIGHIHYFDWVAISNGFATPSGTEVDPISIHTDKINTTQLSYTTLLNINMSWLVPLIQSYDTNDTTRVNQIYNNIVANQTTWQTDLHNWTKSLAFTGTTTKTLTLTLETGTVANTFTDIDTDTVLNQSSVGALGIAYGFVTSDNDTQLNQTTVQTFVNGSASTFTGFKVNTVVLNPTYNATHWCLGVGC